MNVLRKSALVLVWALTMAVAGHSQSLSRERISGENGLSAPVVRLSNSESFPFTAEKVVTALGLPTSFDFRILREETDPLGKNYRLQQEIGGVPVENSMYIVQTRNGNVTVMSGAVVLEEDPNREFRTVPALESSRAIQSALSRVNASRYAWEDQDMEAHVQAAGGASNRPKAELVWFSGIDQLDADQLRLAYKVTVYALEPLSRAAYYFDAADGTYLGSKDLLFFIDAVGTASTVYSGTQTIHSDSTGATSFRLRDYTKGNGVITLHGETSTHSDYTSTSSSWSYTTNDKYALDAHFGVSSTWSFYNANFGRNSINNAGFALTSYVNETATTNNAYWDGSIMHYGVRSTTSAGITAIDIAAHELTHGLTQYTSGLNYSNESGAINESMSDIFGKAVQFWAKPANTSWLLSSDMNWLIRSLANPKQYGQPNCYQGTYWYTGTADNGGVHTNSGVGNFFYYLLVNGGSATNDKGAAYTVTGLGLTTANAIIYRSETNYLTPTSNYAAWRTACINAATDLYGAVSNEVDQVKNAWYAVGVGSAANACDAPTGLLATTRRDTSAVLTWTSSTSPNYNLQWKAASATTWNTVTGLTTNSYTVSGLTRCTSYQFQVQNVCSLTTSAYSTATSFVTTGCTYCASNGTSTTRGWINRITLGTISNTSGNNSGYGNYTTLTTNLTGGSSYSIGMTPGFSGSSSRQYWVVWIDYNQNGLFTDVGEKVATGNGTGIVSRSFTIPRTALNGPTRMRVQMQYAAATTSSCQVYTSGEVEDYTVNITGNAAFSLTGEGASVVPADLLSPNPADDHVRWNFVAEQDGAVQIRILSLTGAVVLEKQAPVFTGSNEIQLDIRELNNGLYFIQSEGAWTQTRRLLIQR